MRTISDNTHRSRPARVSLLLSLLATLALAATPALASVREERDGARLLNELRTGQVTCSTLTLDDFDHIGEYVMGRRLGSVRLHEAMNQRMTAMMGSSGETQAHVYMGQRFAGCARGRAPAAFSGMMGMMGGRYGGGMMDPGGGTMRGFSNRGGMISGTDGGWTATDTVFAVLLGLLLAASIGALVVRRRSSPSPIEILEARYARGEIDQAEFDRRRQALGGTA